MELMVVSKMHSGCGGGGMTDVHCITMQLKSTDFGVALRGVWIRQP